MRIVTFIVILYAFLSILAPSLNPLSGFEATGLLFYRPWEWCFELLASGPEAGGRDPDPLDANIPGSGSNPTDPMLRWWEEYLPIPGSGDGSSLVGIRSVERIRPGQKRILYHTGPSVPVKPRDPVVVEGALVGFVDRLEGSSMAWVVLLLHEESPSVKGVVTGPVAGGKEVTFVAGGASQEIEGCIRLRIIKDPLGIEEGSTAFTKAVDQIPGVPSGLLLGRVRLRKREGGIKRDAALEPAFPAHRLCRAAVLVPRERVDGAESFFLPRLETVEVPARVRLFQPGRGQRARFRIHAGLESGLSRGDILLAGGFAVGMIDRVGLYAGSGALLLDKGEEANAALFPPSGPPRHFRFRVLDRIGLFFMVEAGTGLEGLERGMEVYLSGRPCSGLGGHPAFRVSDPGDGRIFCLEVPFHGGRDGSYCVYTRLSP